MCHTATEIGQKEHTFHVPHSYRNLAEGTHITCVTQLQKLDRRNIHSMCHTATETGQKKHTCATQLQKVDRRNTHYMCQTAIETGHKEHTFHVPHSYGNWTEGTHIVCATQLQKLDRRNTHYMCHTATETGQKEHKTKSVTDQPIRYTHSKTFEGLSSSTDTLLWCTMSWAWRHGRVCNCGSV
jgi:hypothetical protein